MKHILTKIALCGTALAACVVTLPALAQEQILRVGINSADISTLDPHRASATVDKGPVGWMFNGLVRFPPGSADPADIEPDIAESWTVSEDGTEWVFELRQDVAFHGDWGTLTAEDVVFSLERAGNPDFSSFAAAYEAVEEIEAVDDYTVRIRLAHPIPGFLGLVANYHGGQIVSKAAAEEHGANFGANPVGTGPFAFVEHMTQQHVRFAAHEGHFRGAPEIDGILYQMITSDSSRELAFNSGELDLIYGRREQRWIDNTAARPGNVVDVIWPAEYRTLHINQTIEPFDDVRVREALVRAINVDEIVGFVGEDVGPKGCSVIPSGYLGEDCSSWTIDYDLERAQELLAEAGHPNGISFTSVVSNNTAQLPIMEIVQAQVSQAGITMQLNVVDHPTYHELIRGNASALTFYGAARFPIADTYFTEFYHSDAIVGKPTAITNFSHCDVADEEIEAARIEADEERQLELWAQAQAKIHEQICAVPLFNLRQVWLRHEGLDYGYELEGTMNLAPPITEATRLTPR